MQTQFIADGRGGFDHDYVGSGFGERSRQPE
jgi:hypothetical protein